MLTSTPDTIDWDALTNAGINPGSVTVSRDGVWTVTNIDGDAKIAWDIDDIDPDTGEDSPGWTWTTYTRTFDGGWDTVGSDGGPDTDAVRDALLNAIVRTHES